MISYRMLLESDAEAFAQIRLSQLREEGAQETEGVGDAIAEYCREHVPDGSFVAHLALDGEKIIGTCGVSVAHKPPYFLNPGGKIALLSSMYVLPEYRRRGIARTLVIGSPVYWHNLSGSVRVLLERLYGSLERGGLSGKRVALVFQGTAPEKWMIDAGEYSVKMLATLYGMEYLGMAQNEREAKRLAERM